MLDRIMGRVLEKRAGQAVIEAGGLGLRVKMAIPAFLALPEPPGKALVLTRLVIREENWEIFGFLAPAEREAFDILTSVSRVGPRLALAVLSSLEPKDLAHIVVNQDLASLAAVKGIGSKTAERLLVELKDKAPKLAAMAGPADPLGPKKGQALDEAALALVNLGYSRSEAEKAVRGLKLAEGADLETVIKAALRAASP
jgi:Holliday junction DNA helicase RuvA